MELAPNPYIGSRLLALPAVLHRVVFSDMHIYRLEHEGLFPARVHLCDRRVGWPEEAVISWMQSKVNLRPCAQAVIGSGDRFLDYAKVRHLTSLSRQQLNRLEKRGQFPCRIPLGVTRVAWLEREVTTWAEGLRYGAFWAD